MHGFAWVQMMSKLTQVTSVFRAPPETSQGPLPSPQGLSSNWTRTVPFIISLVTQVAHPLGLQDPAWHLDNLRNQCHLNRYVEEGDSVGFGVD